MFTCRRCGHPDYVHTNWTGPCVHNDLKPKDGTTCDCQRMI